MNSPDYTSELAKLEAEISKYEKEIEAFENHDNPLRNYRYVLDFRIDGGGDSGDTYTAFGLVYNRLPIVTRSFVVRKDTIFVCKGIEFSYAIIGTLLGGTQSATIEVPESVRNLLFDFQVKMRDTGSDRDLQNDWIPSEALFSGNRRGLMFGNGHVLLSGGSEFSLTVQAGANLGTSVSAGITNGTATSSILQFSFIGVEVKL